MDNLTLDHVYLAGPMTGLPDHNYPAFHAAADELRAKGFSVINPAAQPPKRDWAEYLRFDLISLLEHCYGVVLLPGWDDSKGAMTEFYVAAALGIPTVEIHNELGLARLLRDRGATPLTHEVVFARDLPLTKELRHV